MRLNEVKAMDRSLMRLRLFGQRLRRIAYLLRVAVFATTDGPVAQDRAELCRVSDGAWSKRDRAPEHVR